MKFRSNTVKIILLAAIGACVYIAYLPKETDLFENVTGGQQAEWDSKLTENTKVILLYTTFFGNNKWHGLQGSELHTHFKNYNCLTTYNKSSLQQADAVVFHGRDVELNWKYSAKLLKSLRQHVPKKQKWIFLSHENAKKNSHIYEPYNGVFNWTATFSRKSDVFIPYSAYKLPVESPPISPENYAEGKSRLVAWAVSNCNLMRQDYVKQLENYINVTVYGACRHFFKKSRDCAHHDPVCKQEISSYKFYLAFENAFCDDYVTEKYWERIEQGTVPIVMGATYDKGLVIPGSYIDAADFSSIKSLADYLLYLDSNDTAYNEYFKWKSSYIISDGGLHIRICQALYSDKFKETSQVILSETFSQKAMCHPFDWKKEKLLQQIKKSKKITQNSVQVGRALKLGWAWFKAIFF